MECLPIGGYVGDWSRRHECFRSIGSKLDDHWHIRIKEGEFIESVFSFGEISIDNKSDMMKFNVTLHSSPDEELTTDNLHFQRYAGKILESVMFENLNEMSKNEQ